MEEQSVSVLSDAIIEQRKEKLIGLLKNNPRWLSYLILAFFIILAIFIRTRPMSINPSTGKPGLWDITTDSWTLGPDLDPFLFLRWAEHIVQHGKLFVFDNFRYVPLGYNTAGEMKLLSYLIAWFHQLLSVFSITESVAHSAVIFPVAAFAFTALGFFFFSRKIVSQEKPLIKESIALLATLIFVLVPSLLPRTIAGIPEKESIAFGFMFFAFYFFISAFQEKRIWKGYLFAVLAGLFSIAMALVWGAVGLLILTIVIAFSFSFLLGHIDKHKFFMFGIWLLMFLTIPGQFSTRYLFKNLLTSFSTGAGVAIFCIAGLYLLLFKKIEHRESIKKYTKNLRIPLEFISAIIVGVILALLASLLFGFSFIPDKIRGAIDQAVHPLATTRFGITVAENKQPFFVSDWKGSFGPEVLQIPLFFWLFFIGALVLFISMIKKLERKERIILSVGYALFLFSLIFSKYSPGSVLNGDSAASLMLYFGGMLALICCFAYIYFKRYRDEQFSIFKEFDFGIILYFIILTLAIMAARGGVRLLLVLGAVSPLAIAFFTVKSIDFARREKEEFKKFIAGALAVLIVLSLVFTLWSYYQSDLATAKSYVPSIYTNQWQKSMSWVREETPENSVFAHWWDYGYWVQSIGKRATVLDGGNAIVYWDHLMGRYVLTESDQRKSIEFLYTHNATHLLIDSTDIGKYTAFSSIGSDENYDRISWIPTFIKDDKQSIETRNGTMQFYSGGTGLDQDIIWKNNGSEIIIPREQGILAGVFIPKTSEGLGQPQAVFLFRNRNQRYDIPLRYLYFKNNLIDFKTGLDAGVFVYLRAISVGNGQIGIQEDGAILYLSQRTIHSTVARLYLMNQSSPYFKLINSQDDLVVESIKQQGLIESEFIDYAGFRGPIKIWEIDYPAGLQINPAYLETDYPSPELNLAKPGYY